MANWKRIIHGDSHMPIHMQFSMRWYLGAYPSFSGTARRRWMTPSTTYGANYYQWNSYYTNANPRTNWYKSYNPCIVAPCDAQVKEWYLIGNLIANVGTGLDGGDIKIQLDTTETSPSYDNTSGSSALPLSTIGGQQTLTITEGSQFKIGQEVGANMSLQNANIEKGAILVPQMCRDFNLDSSTNRYIEGVFGITMWRKIGDTDLEFDT